MTVHFNVLAMEWLGFGVLSIIVGYLIVFFSLFKYASLTFLGAALAWAGVLVAVMGIGAQIFLWM